MLQGSSRYEKKRIPDAPIAILDMKNRIISIASRVIGIKLRNRIFFIRKFRKYNLPQRHDDHDGHNEITNATHEGKSRPFFTCIFCFPVVAVVVVVSSW